MIDTARENTYRVLNEMGAACRRRTSRSFAPLSHAVSEGYDGGVHRGHAIEMIMWGGLVNLLSKMLP